MKITLSSDQIHTLTCALRIAAEKYRVDAGEMGKLAKHLRDGGKFPLFADGEDGARAADGLKDQFYRQAVDADKVSEHLEDEENAYWEDEDAECRRYGT